jgi:hypothetical protein
MIFIMNSTRRTVKKNSDRRISIRFGGEHDNTLEWRKNRCGLGRHPGESRGRADFKYLDSGPVFERGKLKIAGMTD